MHLTQDLSLLQPQGYAKCNDLCLMSFGSSDHQFIIVHRNCSLFERTRFFLTSYWSNLDQPPNGCAWIMAQRHFRSFMIFKSFIHAHNQIMCIDAHMAPPWAHILLHWADIKILQRFKKKSWCTQHEHNPLIHRRYITTYIYETSTQE